MQSPLVSIIIPTFNSQDTLAGCLESVCTQTFKDFEICIQDGGSIDSTLQIVHEFRTRYPAIPFSIVSEKDTGIYDAMNRAARRSPGAWLYFLGSDDELRNPSVMQQMADAIWQYPEASLVYGNVYRKQANDIHFGKFDLEKLLGYNICHQAIVTKREVFDEYGPFDVRFTACADWAFNIKLYKAGVKFQYIDIIVADYNDGGFSNNFWDAPFFEYLDLERKAFFANPLNRVKSKVRRIYKRVVRAIPNLK